MAESDTEGLNFEKKLWATADKLRNNMDAAEYKHVVLGLIFLKYISDSFGEKHGELLEKVKKDEYIDPEEEDDGIPFEEKMEGLVKEYKESVKEGDKLDKEIEGNLKGLGVWRGRNHEA